METQLGLLRAAVIIWVSRLVVSAILGSLISPLAWSLVAGSDQHGDHRWAVTAVIVALHALVGAVGVTVGVGFFDFRISYASAVFALVVGGVLLMVLLPLLTTQTASSQGDPRGVAIPALGLAFWPLQLLLGTVLPAYIVNSAARPSAPVAAPPAYPPYPPTMH